METNVQGEKLNEPQIGEPIFREVTFIEKISPDGLRKIVELRTACRNHLGFLVSDQAAREVAKGYLNSRIPSSAVEQCFGNPDKEEVYSPFFHWPQWDFSNESLRGHWMFQGPSKLLPVESGAASNPGPTFCENGSDHSSSDTSENILEDISPRQKSLKRLQILANWLASDCSARDAVQKCLLDLADQELLLQWREHGFPDQGLLLHLEELGDSNPTAPAPL